MTVSQIYGIKNCDTVKKARKWLTEKEVPHDFVDLRGGALTSELVARWIADVGLDNLVNKKSTSWRGLTEKQKNQLTPDSATQLLQEIPTLIKRPVLVIAGQTHVGFSPEKYQNLLNEGELLA